MMAAEFDCGDSIKADIFCAVVMLGHKLVVTVQIVESGSLSIGGAGCVFCHGREEGRECVCRREESVEQQQ